jgi:hypothetical protein
MSTLYYIIYLFSPDLLLALLPHEVPFRIVLLYSFPTFLSLISFWRCCLMRSLFTLFYTVQFSYLFGSDLLQELLPHKVSFHIALLYNFLTF